MECAAALGSRLSCLPETAFLQHDAGAGGGLHAAEHCVPALRPSLCARGRAAARRSEVSPWVAPRQRRSRRARPAAGSAGHVRHCGDLAQRASRVSRLDPAAADGGDPRALDRVLRLHARGATGADGELAIGRPMPVLNVKHLTTYRYKQPVAFGEHRMMLRPRDYYDQKLLEAKL